MSASKQILHGKRECLSSEYRVLDPTHRAIKLINENVCSERAAAEVTGISRSTIMRAKSAQRSGRPVGRRGNPPIFEEHEEFEFYTYIHSTLIGNKYYTNEELRNEVKTFQLQTSESYPLM